MSHFRSFSPKPPTFVLVALLVAWISMLLPFTHAALAREAADAGPENSPVSPADAAWQIQNLFPPGAIWQSTWRTPLVLDSQGWPHVGYINQNGGWYAYKDASGWHHQLVIRHLNEIVMKLDAADRPHIAYLTDDPQAVCRRICYARLNGTTWQYSSVDQSGSEFLI